MPEKLSSNSPNRYARSTDAVASMIVAANRILSRIDSRFSAQEAAKIIRQAQAKLVQISDLVDPSFRSKYLNSWVRMLSGVPLQPGEPRANRIDDVLQSMGDVSRPMRAGGKWPSGTGPSGESNAGAKQQAEKIMAARAQVLKAYQICLRGKNYTQAARLIEQALPVFSDTISSSAYDKLETAMQLLKAKSPNPQQAAKLVLSADSDVLATARAYMPQKSAKTKSVKPRLIG